MSADLEVLDTWGYTSTIYLLPGQPPKVCKAFNEDCVQSHFEVEKEAYERFSKHDHPSSILCYHGVHDSVPAGLVLDLADHGNLDKYLWDQKQFGHLDPTPEMLYRWAAQVAEALDFAHGLGVYNSDIHCVNFFLDQELNLKVGDWAGASIDGSLSQSSYRLRHRLYDSDGVDHAGAFGITRHTEIFALGTAFYYMATGLELWPELREPEDDEEIKRRLASKDFPATDILPVLGEVISKCWHVEYDWMTDVKEAVEADRKAWLRSQL